MIENPMKTKVKLESHKRPHRMALRIIDKGLEKKIQRNLKHHNEEHSDALVKLSSGNVFTAKNKSPSDKVIAEKMEFRLRGLAASKNKVNDAVSMVQTAESALTEISNTIIRLKEINLTAASDTVSKQERRYLFVEHQALFDELNRIAEVTEFNGIPLLNPSNPESPEQLLFGLDDPFSNDGEEDINTIIFKNFKDIDTTTNGLGLLDSFDLLSGSDSEEGVEIAEAERLLEANNDDFATSYDEAINKLANQRAELGSLLSRFQKIIDYNDVYQENITAARSKIADTDFAETTAKLVSSRIMAESTTALMAQVSAPAAAALTLVKAIF